MARDITYHPARAMAANVEAHFARHLAEARRRGEHDLAAAPSAEVIEAIVDATFWASLRPEEGRFPKISLAFLSPEQAGQPLMFERRLPLVPAILTRLAPAVERPGIHLGVWSEGGELYVWGATRVIPSFGFVLEDVEPGLLVIKHRRIDGFGKFANVVVLKGEQVKIVDEQGTSLPDCPALLKSLLAFTSSSWYESVNVLVQLAASMRAHGQGGSLLIVPAGSENWRESIVHPILYSVVPSFSRLADLVERDLTGLSENVWEASVRRAVDTVAGLTAVDGATIITDRYEVLAFGTKIRRPDRSAPVERIVLTEPIFGNQAEEISPTQLGNTRHLSAAQFVNDQRDALALVASQDGRFTIFAWSPCEEMVHAHRVDVLLL
jgi:sensor domain DACNV-containing protein